MSWAQISSSIFWQVIYFWQVTISFMLFTLSVKWEVNNVSARIPPKQASAHIVLCFCYQDILQWNNPNFQVPTIQLQTPIQPRVHTEIPLRDPLPPTQRQCRNYAAFWKQSHPTQSIDLLLLRWKKLTPLLSAGTDGRKYREASQTTGKCVLRMIISSFILMLMWGRGGGRTAKG